MTDHTPDRDPKQRRPLSTRDPLGDPHRCGHYGHRRKGDGRLCVGPVVAGTTSCRMHAGKPTAQAVAQGQIRDDLAGWGLGDATVNPHDMYLRLISQAAVRVDRYSRMLGEAYQAAERLRLAHRAQSLVLVEPEGSETPDGDQAPAAQAAYEDLRRVFVTGGLAALVGHTYNATHGGQLFATQEAIRALVKLEGDERKFLADMCAKAIAAGLAERQVRVAERRGIEMAAVFRQVFAGLDLTPVQWARVPGLLQEAVAHVTGITPEPREAVILPWRARS